MKGGVPLYLAGPSQEAWRVRRWAHELLSSGIVQLTSRWFDTAEEWSGRDALLDDREQQKRVRENFAALRRAEIVWVLWPEVLHSEGAPAELGYALAQRWHCGRTQSVRVIVSGSRVRSSITTSEADFVSRNDEAALQQCLEFGRVARGWTTRSGSDKHP